MNEPKDLELESFKKEGQEKKEKDPEQEKLNENSNTTLKQFKVIERFNYSENNLEKGRINILSAILLFIIIILILLLFSTGKMDKNKMNQNFNLQNPYNQKKVNNPLDNEGSITDVKNTNTNSNITEKENNANNNANVIQRKTVLGFLFPELTIFMITNGEYFSNSGKYDVIFLTQSPVKGELKYNKNIKRMYCYFDRNLIYQICKNNNIDFLIVNSDLSADDIKWLKSLNIKLIAISKDFENKNQSNDLKLFDAYINQNYEDFNISKRIDLKNNLLIPDMINLDLRDMAHLSNHKIMMLGELNESTIHMSTFLSSFSLIIKEIPDTKINFFSLDKPSNELNELIKSYNLKQNIHFYPLNETISNDITNYSLFIYASKTQDYQSILFDAKSYGLPCVSLVEFPDNLFFQSGVISLNITKNDELVVEIMRLLVDNKYKKAVGKEIKYSLKMINDEIEILWEYLFQCLKKDENEFQNLRANIERRIQLMKNL